MQVDGKRKRKQVELEEKEEQPKKMELSSLLSSIKEGMEEDLRLDNEEALKKGKRQKNILIEFDTKDGKKVKLRKISRVHRLTEQQQLARVMNVIHTLVQANVVPTSRNIRSLGIGSG
jgi:hypothetical protein